MATKFREGSEGAASQKANKRWLIAALIILGIVYLELYLGIFLNSYMHQAVDRADWYAVVPSLFLNAACVYFLVKAVQQGDLGKNPLRNTILWVIALILAISMAGGFNFDLAGMVNRP